MTTSLFAVGIADLEMVGAELSAVTESLAAETDFI